MPEGMFVGLGDEKAMLLPKYCNRHGLIAGATGTGKTVTLQCIAEQLSEIGTCVFMADVKGDLAGLSQVGGGNPKIEARAKEIGCDPMPYQSYPVTFWDVFGEQGHRVRATISELGPLLLSRMLELNDTQEGVLNVVFRVADDQGMLLLDLKDLRAMLAYCAENAESLRAQYGNVTSTSVGAVQRQLLVLEEQGGDIFFGEPALDIDHLLTKSKDGRGMINVLSSDKLMQSPRLYSTFLLWLLSELYEQLPEAGDLEQPKLVFFFDEAHLLFADAPGALLQKIEQVVRLIRSKGVGIFFVTQHPLDIPDSVLSQLSNRFQHALRAFTPRDQKAVNTAAETFRKNPKFKTEEVITNLGIGEALVSVLGADGTPTIVDRVKIKPPNSHLGVITTDQRNQLVVASGLEPIYAKTIDRESAYEVLIARHQQDELEAQAQAQAQEEAKRQAQAERQGVSRGDSIFGSFMKSAARALGSQLTRNLLRGVLGGLVGGRRRR